MAFSGDGRLLASASSDRTVRVWDVAAAKCVAVLTGHTDEVFSAVFHPDGKRLASAGRDRAIWLWDLATGQEVARLEGHTNYVFSLAFSPDGTSSGVRFRRRYGPDLGHRAAGACAIRPVARPRPCGPRPSAWSRASSPSYASQPRSLPVCGPTTSLSDPLRHAAVREVMRRGQRAMP